MTDPEIEITAELVHALLKDQHPDLAGLAIREVAGGWGNQMWRLGDELVVRMPRTEQAPDLLRKECRWLPVLAPRLPLPVPTPVRIGEPSARFPRPWAIFEVYALADEATIRRARGLAALKCLFLILMGQNGEQGLPGGKPTWGPAGRAALDRVLTSNVRWPSPA